MALVCFLLSIAALAYAVTRIVRQLRAPKQAPPGSGLRTLTLGVFCSAWLIFLPVYEEMFFDDIGSLLKTLFISAHNVLRLFVLDGEFDIMNRFTSGLNPILGSLYSNYAAFLYLFTPVLTFSFVLSMFRNITSFLRMLLGRYSDLYVFSAMTDQSVTLAESIRSEHRSAQIVFAKVPEQEEQNYDLVCRVRDLRALGFRSDLLGVNLRFQSKSAAMNFFILGPDEEENLSQSLQLLQKYRDRDATRLYLFSNSTQSEMLLSTAPTGKVKVRRVDEVGALVDQLLYKNGTELFEGARPQPDGTKRITAVVVGLDGFGSRMLRSLTWLCQMDGYDVVLHAFDADPLAASRFSAQCPELMDPRLNGTRPEGESRYEIVVHSGLAPDTAEFAQAIAQLPDATCVFVSLGDDAQNVHAAVYLRALFERRRLHPRIKAIVRSTGSKDVLLQAKNYRGQAYDIDFIGDTASIYNVHSILKSELEQEALARHLNWGVEEDFWRYEYNYRSSVAAAIHLRMRIACGLPWADKPASELTEAERDALEQLEHRRWNAYMRTEGYSWSGSRDKASRNDLAKLHQDLVPFAALSEDDKRKDSSVGTK